MKKSFILGSIGALVYLIIILSCSIPSETEEIIDWGLFGMIDETEDTIVASKYYYDDKDWGEPISDYVQTYRTKILSGKLSPLGAIQKYKTLGTYSISSKSQFNKDNSNDGYFTFNIKEVDIAYSRFELSSLDIIYKPTIPASAYRITLDTTANQEFTQKLPSVESVGSKYEVVLSKSIPVKKLSNIIEVTDVSIYNDYPADQKFIWNDKYYVGSTLIYSYLKNFRATFVVGSIKNEDTPSVSKITVSPVDSLTPTINVSFGEYCMDQTVKSIFVNNVEYAGKWIDSSNLSYTVTTAFVAASEVWIDVPEVHKTIDSEPTASPFSKLFSVSSTATPTDPVDATTDVTTDAVALTLGSDFADFSLSVLGEIDWYFFDATKDVSYDISWKDKLDPTQSGYTCNVKTSAYREDLVTGYFLVINDGFTTPQTIVATETERVYIKIEAQSTTNNSTGTYALKVSETP